MINNNGKSMSFKDLSKKINWKLSANFFSLDEARCMSSKKLKKVIKLIAKVEGIKLKRQEIKDLITFIRSDFKEVKKDTVTKLWDFVVDYEKTIQEEKETQSIFEHQIIISSYKIGRFELMLN